MKIPATARFSYQPESTVIQAGGPRWHVTGVVDAHNDLGTLTRSNFTCSVTYLGNDKWHATDIQVIER